MNFQALFSATPPPSSLPKEPILFHPTDETFPTTLASAFRYIEKSAPFEFVGKLEQVSSLAVKAKHFLDKNFNEGPKVNDVANACGVSASSLSRAFKKCYGMTPLAYANQLKLMDSWRLMTVQGEAVSQAAFAVGFRDLSRFNHQFKKKHKAVPSQFRRKNC